VLNQQVLEGIIHSKDKNMARIIQEAPELTIAIEGDGAGFGAQSLYTRAVVHLIHQADVSGWQKHGDGTEPDRFRAAVLSALASQYVADSVDWEENQQKSVPEILQRIVADIQANAEFPPIDLGDDDE
jgi:hypothetical protein